MLVLETLKNLLARGNGNRDWVVGKALQVSRWVCCKALQGRGAAAEVLLGTAGEQTRYWQGTGMMRMR